MQQRARASIHETQIEPANFRQIGHAQQVFFAFISDPKRGGLPRCFFQPQHDFAQVFNIGGGQQSIHFGAICQPVINQFGTGVELYRQIGTDKYTTDARLFNSDRFLDEFGNVQPRANQPHYLIVVPDRYIDPNLGGARKDTRINIDLIIQLAVHKFVKPVVIGMRWRQGKEWLRLTVFVFCVAEIVMPGTDHGGEDTATLEFWPVTLQYFQASRLYGGLIFMQCHLDQGGFARHLSRQGNFAHQRLQRALFIKQHLFLGKTSPPHFIDLRHQMLRVKPDGHSECEEYHRHQGEEFGFEVHAVR